MSKDQTSQHHSLRAIEFFMPAYQKRYKEHFHELIKKDYTEALYGGDSAPDPNQIDHMSLVKTYKFFLDCFCIDMCQSTTKYTKLDDIWEQDEDMRLLWHNINDQIMRRIHKAVFAEEEPNENDKLLEASLARLSQSDWSLES